MSLLHNLQRQVADQIGSQPSLGNAAILTEEAGNLENEMARALGVLQGSAGKVGAVILVLTPSATTRLENIPGPFFDKIRILVRVTVNIPLSFQPGGAQLYPLDICETVIATLHQWYPSGASSALYSVPESIALLESNQGISTYDMWFECMAGIAPLPSVVTPVIAEATGVVTLTCTTPGAAIFYTLDAGNPIPRKGTLYTAPFIPGAGHALKARAFLAGYLASATAIQTT